MLLNSLPTSVHAEWSVSNKYQIVPPDVSYLKRRVLEVLWTSTVLSLVMVTAVVVVVVVTWHWRWMSASKKHLSAANACENVFVLLGSKKN